MRANLFGALAALAVLGALGFGVNSLFALDPTPSTQPATSDSQIQPPPAPPPMTPLTPIEPVPATSPSLVPTPPPMEQVQAPPPPTTAPSPATMPAGGSQRLA